MDTLRVGDLTIEAKDEPSRFVVTWAGKSVERNPHRSLDPFFGALLARSSQEKKAVEMNFERLVHFNSSTISFLIQILGDARAKGVRVTLVYDAKMPTQRLSFDALRVFTQDNQLLELKASGDHGQA
jgi:hypothetical protein